jgi:predicted amidohydrolase
LLVFPELSLIGYELGLARANAIDPDSAALDCLLKFAARTGMTVVAGAPVPNGAGGLYAAALVLRPDGSVLIHSKVHVHESELVAFEPGPGGAVFQVGEAAVGLAICRDASFAEHAAGAASHGEFVYAAGVMIDEPGYVRKMPLLQGYAREHEMAVLMANYSGETGAEVSAGKSAIWAEGGAVVAASTGNEEALVIAKKHDGAWSGTVVRIG